MNTDNDRNFNFYYGIFNPTFIDQNFVYFFLRRTSTNMTYILAKIFLSGSLLGLFNDKVYSEIFLTASETAKILKL